MLREFTVEAIHPTQDGDTIYSLLANRALRAPQSVVAQWQDEDTRQWHDVTAAVSYTHLTLPTKRIV